MSKQSDNDKMYPEGHFIGLWTGLGVAIFSGLGVPLSIALDNFAFIGMGPAIGIAVGVAIGQGLETKYKNEGRIRPLNEEEKNRRKMILWGLFAFFLLGFVVLLLIFFKVL
jgi:hypothetical protein